jgi:hypothetical protein
MCTSGETFLSVDCCESNQAVGVGKVGVFSFINGDVDYRLSQQWYILNYLSYVETKCTLYKKINHYRM